MYQRVFKRREKRNLKQIEMTASNPAEVFAASQRVSQRVAELQVLQLLRLWEAECLGAQYFRCHPAL